MEKERHKCTNGRRTFRSGADIQGWPFALVKYYFVVKASLLFHRVKVRSNARRSDHKFQGSKILMLFSRS
ncbi:MAG: hypothetical protein U9N53_03380 [Bacteroidota bacterium]|nr:hypothetical protein [Bacteroidota bacterium]